MRLIVDANRARAEDLRIRLAERGFASEIAADGAAALARLERDRPAAVLVDYALADLSALDLVRAVVERAPEVAVILLLDHPDLHLAVAAGRLGAADCVARDEEWIDRVAAAVGDAPTRPAGLPVTVRAAPIELAGVIDVPAIQTLMDHFHALTGIGTAIVDLQGTVLVATGWQEICTRFHRVYSETAAHCIESDTLLSRGVAPGTYKRYKCRNGMWDIATPLIMGAHQVGNLFLGQFFFEDELPDLEAFRAQARAHGFDEVAYLAALERVPRWSRERVDRAMAFYTCLAELISSLSYGNLLLGSTLDERDRLLASLRESEERYRTVADFTYDWEYWRAPDGRLLYVSPSCERITGQAAATFYQDPELLTRIVHPEDAERVVPVLLGSALHDEPRAIEYRIRTRDGGERWIAHVGLRVRSRDGADLGIRGSNRDITPRRLAEEEILRLNAGLEQRVAERTAELLAVNRELEGFCYSVSHDLRGPLRAIDGYSQVILEDHGDDLPRGVQHHLERIGAASLQMSRLIDGLLSLSRLTRAELEVGPVDLSQTAAAVIEELRCQQPERVVEVEITPGLVARGDARLLRVVVANLLGNAWKFTGRRPRARIEFGIDPSAADSLPGAPVYFVRDNGVGFDMAHAGKLFGAFQRLHGVEEFAGCGIGLATVQRIVQRHAGRVWAAGAVERGATFYFTLGGPPA